ncbi:MAG TPA: septal ring lytic transglycosylase RlpA family protein [Kofleriaceae bacterium]|nr:septal ring lytic transglycosylase RlpA family protein [Kofleriaceae bacterium]
MHALRLARLLPIGLAVGIAMVAAGCTTATTTPGPVNPQPGVSQTQRGMATFYGDEQGTQTASGERFNKNQLTAAHRTLPFGTRVRVTNTKNGRSVVVRINDRGPFGNRGRIIDVSEAAARQLGMIDAGVVPVVLEVLR